MAVSISAPQQLLLAPVLMGKIDSDDSSCRAVKCSVPVNIPAFALQALALFPCGKPFCKLLHSPSRQMMKRYVAGEGR